MNKDFNLASASFIPEINADMPTLPDARSSLGAHMSDYVTVARFSEEFERKWTPQRDYSIENCLDEFNEDNKELLFERLLEIDISLCLENRITVEVSDYKKRFPQWEQIIDHVYSEVSGQSIVINKSRIGTVIANYRILSILGNGGMGIVYEAEDIKLKRKAALKCLLPRLHNDQAYLENFQNEIELQARICSQIFARAYSVHESQGYLFLAMEFIDGINLVKYFNGNNENRTQSGPLPVLQVLNIARQVLTGLQEIHSLNIVHRDIKPENLIYQSNDIIRILDLGVGIGGDQSVQTTGYSNPDSPVLPSQCKTGIAGTRAYLSPEGYKLSSREQDGRCDLYSLGGTLFFLLTGNYPIQWYDPVAHHLTPPVSLAQYLKDAGFDYSSDIVAFLEKLMKPDRNLRYQTAEAALVDLNLLIDRHSKTFCQRWAHTIKAASIAIATVVTLVVCAVVYLHMDHNRRFDDMVDLYNRGDYIASLAKLESLHPNRMTLDKKKKYLLLSGELYPKLGRDDKYTDKALKAYSELLELDSGRFDFLEKMVMLYVNNRGDYETARNLVIRTLKQYPFSNALKLLDGKILVMQCLSLSGASDETRKQLLNDAIGILMDVQASAESLFWRGEAYLLLNCTDFALDDFDKALDLDINYWQAGMASAKIRFAQLSKRKNEKPLAPKDVLDMIASLERVLEKIPADTIKEKNFCLEFLAQCHAWNNNHTQSLACYDKIHEPGPMQKFHRNVSFFLKIIQNGEESSTRQQWQSLLDNLRIIHDGGLDYYFPDQRAELSVITAIACLHLHLYQECLAATNDALKSNSKKVLYRYLNNDWNLYDIRRLAWVGLGNIEEARKDAKRSMETMIQSSVSNAILQ